MPFLVTVYENDSRNSSRIVSQIDAPASASNQMKSLSYPLFL